MASVSKLLEPHDVIEAAEAVRDALGDVVEADWSVPAGGLEWDVRTTPAHAAGATAKYSLCLSAQTTRYIALHSSAYPDASNADLLAALGATAASLARVAESASPGGFHMAGMADAEGFLGMACVEILVHGADAARGLGVDFTPPDDLCRRTASRLFPWAPSESPGWATLCWATGRGGLEGQEPLDSSWLWHCPPLSEWDGQIRTVRNLVAEWVLDDGSGRWRPVAP